jgi:hypothetical protein
MKSCCHFCVDPSCGGKKNCNCETCSRKDSCYRYAGLKPTIRITRKCTQTCQHCAFDCGPGLTGTDMTMETAENIHRFCQAHQIRFAETMGGEFYTHPEWAAVLHTLFQGTRSVRLVIRRDALRALDYMREDVFAKGEPQAAPMKFNPGVYLYWNIASLLRILGNTKDSGVSLVLIQDTEEINASCFGFAIKHGNNLFLLSDKPKFDNPEQATLQSSRGGSRELAHRMEKLRFPYGFMGAWIDEKGRGQMNIPGATMPVRAQQEAVKLAEMKDLPADTLIWLAMMFDLISARYWKNLERIKAKELSYTGDMIETPMALTEGCQALAIRDYKPLQFEKFTTENVTSDHVQFRVNRTGQNRWMEERYKSQVPEELLNPLPSSTPAFPEHLLPPLPHPNEIIARRDAEQAMQLLAPKKLRNELWGTHAEMRHNHMWVARKNFAATIERLSIEEFNREKEAVTKWYVERLTANRDFWLRGLAEGKLMLPAPASTKGFQIVQTPGPRIERNELAFYRSNLPAQT